MPLSELYRLANRMVDSNQGFEPRNDVFELVWENGQITTTQGQSSRVTKDPTCHSLPSYTPKSPDKDLVGNAPGNTRTAKFGTVVDSVMSEIPMSVPSEEVGLSHEDDMIPWLNYPIDGSDFLPELSGVTANEVSKSNGFVLNDKSSCNRMFNESNADSVDYSGSLEQRDVAKIVASVGAGDAIRPRTGASQLYATSSSQQCQASFPSFRSQVDGNSSVAHHAVCSGSAEASSTSFASLKMQKPDTNVINFSHFTRPIALARANCSIQSTPNMERVSSKDKGCATNVGNSNKMGLIDLSIGLRKGTSLQCQIGASSGVDSKLLESRPTNEPCSGARDSEAVWQDDASKNDMSSNQIACESTTRGLPESGKIAEPMVASSSVCSGNSMERASGDPAHVLKRKFRETEDSECHSEDVEEESVGAKKMGLSRPSGSKRSRAAEVHNLSERRRRDRINEKMRALQELIPNCNKVDKASMLDEAIEYLKTLQLQVQIMSTSAGLCMLPTRLPHMAHFSPMGIGIGMGLGMGFGMGLPDMSSVSSGYPMIQVPPMQGVHFPGTPIPGHAATFHGMAGPNLQAFGLHGQGTSMPMQPRPLVPMMGGPFMKSSVALNTYSAGSMENTESAQPYASNGTSQKPVADCSVNQTPSQRQTENRGFEKSALVQNSVQPSDANVSNASASASASASADGNEAKPTGAASK